MAAGEPAAGQMQCSGERTRPPGSWLDRRCGVRQTGAVTVVEPAVALDGVLGWLDVAFEPQGTVRMASPYELARPPGPEPTLAGERDRTARRLESEVIQRIFAIGLTLQDAAAIAVDPLVRDRIEKAISDTESVIQIIRNTVLDGEHRPGD